MTATEPVTATVPAGGPPPNYTVTVVATGHPDHTPAYLRILTLLGRCTVTELQRLKAADIPAVQLRLHGREPRGEPQQPGPARPGAR